MPLNNSKKYMLRDSYYYYGIHFKDNIKNLGADYRNKVFKKITSPELWSNPLQWSLYANLESLMVYIFDYAKMIKKTYSIAHNKNDININ